MVENASIENIKLNNDNQFSMSQIESTLNFNNNQTKDMQLLFNVIRYLLGFLLLIIINIGPYVYYKYVKKKRVSTKTNNNYDFKHSIT